MKHYFFKIKPEIGVKWPDVIDALNYENGPLCLHDDVVMLVSERTDQLCYPAFPDSHSESLADLDICNPPLDVCIALISMHNKKMETAKKLILMKDDIGTYAMPLGSPTSCQYNGYSYGSVVYHWSSGVSLETVWGPYPSSPGEKLTEWSKGVLWAGSGWHNEN